MTLFNVLLREANGMHLFSWACKLAATIALNVPFHNLSKSTLLSTLAAFRDLFDFATVEDELSTTEADSIMWSSPRDCCLRELFMSDVKLLLPRGRSNNSRSKNIWITYTNIQFWKMRWSGILNELFPKLKTMATNKVPNFNNRHKKISLWRKMRN